ncbi:hypothetical protein EPIR_3389 [Erwinia piriflorinigrans CFBP 5888]|uniref:Uncharacterized protein n=1 Tax=Erwinia piriflorinigrans CFBP 5888 TaxID=1161919 RepID=V5ZCI8_9GAMM|nr:hypothetical protein EPIR_3389 [Erwinia piriflorinigrans CFBP 5888]
MTIFFGFDVHHGKFVRLFYIFKFYTPPHFSAAQTDAKKIILFNFI